MQALQNIQDFLKGVKMDSQRAALLTGVVCAVGSVVVLAIERQRKRSGEPKTGEMRACSGESRRCSDTKSW